jgi:spermidine synthase
MSEQKLVEQSLAQSATRIVSPRFLPFLLILFFGSGCAALIYEIVWFQLLQLVIGSTGVSLGVLLGAFMGGMCVGSIGFARVVPSGRHPLRIYGAIEMAIGVCGIAVQFAIPLIGRVYIAVATDGLPGLLLRGLLCAVCLLPPTVLMGASLPAIARWVETTPEGVSWLGFFYGGNTAGAVFGCVLAGFYLLRLHDMATATFVAAAINVAVALASLGLAGITPREASDGARERTAQMAAQPWSLSAPGSGPAYLAIALSGLCALGAEVIWTRQLGLMLGATVYTFSIILAVFLAGLGIGSAGGAFLSRRALRPGAALGWCQLLLAAAIAWSAYMINASLPFWPINPTLAANPWQTMQLDLARALWALFPAACLWGASFPLALAAAASPGQDPGRLAGRVYAANTAGAIAGALAFSMLLIPWLGSQKSQQILIALSAGAALLMLWPLLWPARRDSIIGVVACSAAVASLVWLVPETPWLVTAFGRQLPYTTETGHLLYMGEGMNASVAVSEYNDGTRFFHVSGKTEASTEPYDMRMQRMLGHIPALLHSRPQSVLVVGCGAGVTAGTFTLYPDVQRILICELEPLVPKAVTEYFSNQNYNVLRDKRTRVVFDDARHFVLTTPQKFDIITSDPIHPWVKGSATLYSAEYFEMVKRHLNPGGMVTQWVPLYESNLETVQSEIATFFSAFPNGTVWANDINGTGYDLVLLGQAGPAKIDLDALEQRLHRADYGPVANSLSEVNFQSSLDLMATYSGRAPDLKAWLARAEINRDRNLRLQYLAGLGLNSNQEDAIYKSLLSHRRFPEELFTGSEARRQALHMLMERGAAVPEDDNH